MSLLNGAKKKDFFLITSKSSATKNISVRKKKHRIARHTTITKNISIYRINSKWFNCILYNKIAAVADSAFGETIFRERGNL